MTKPEIEVNTPDVDDPMWVTILRRFEDFLLIVQKTIASSLAKTDLREDLQTKLFETLVPRIMEEYLKKQLETGLLGDGKSVPTRGGSMEKSLSPPTTDSRVFSPPEGRDVLAAFYARVPKEARPYLQSQINGSSIKVRATKQLETEVFKVVCQAARDLSGDYQQGTGTWILPLK